jgi:hypothetical protein
MIQLDVQRIAALTGVRPRHARLRQQHCRLACSRPEHDGSSVERHNGTAAASDYAMGKSGYWQLLSAPDPDMFTRAPSASDAAALRRKGHLKEQDSLIEFLRSMHATHKPREVMQKMDRWILEHRMSPRLSRLKRMVPTVGHFFTPLSLVEAFDEYDSVFSLSRRQYVPPNFAELRHILNIAQVHASAAQLKLITFDADGTLYADGAHMEQDNQMIGHIINLMRSDVYVGIVTAAGYPGQPDRFEQRMAGLLKAFQDLSLPADITSRCVFPTRCGSCSSGRAGVCSKLHGTTMLSCWLRHAALRRARCALATVGLVSCSTLIRAACSCGRGSCGSASGRTTNHTAVCRKG